MRRWLDAYVLGELSERQAERFESHVARCADCRVELEQHRRRATRAARYTSALPVVSARPGERRAGQPGSAYAVAVGADTGPNDTVSGTPRAAWTPEGRSFWREAVPVIAVLAVCGLLAVFLSTAWALGGGNASSRSAAPVTAEWDETGRELSTQTVTDLRRAGWNLPSLNMVGYQLGSAVGSTVDGVPRVTLTYAGPAGDVVVSEQRKLAPVLGSASAQVPNGAAGEDGAATTPGSPGGPAPAGALSASVGADSSNTSLVDTANAVYEVTFPADEAGRDVVVNRIMLTENSQLEHAPAQPDSALARLGKGLARMGVLEVVD
ncbi:zf-HC2 domain-containing protein [Zhihengliuella salsuginis]|uniref:Putative zinc-finger domain-containing protein n=1 Tax=Zhihengliuella salsuginis TaxID=578222 RepID=A0ABQ3GER2_9MICC|nr:zf-HC2 domain-containing protein [Zhihengliuella salsuginis]GHD03779.1 hypothetical protein GCM10008096_10270 [Zhihengliuella salsuginis]